MKKDSQKVFYKKVSLKRVGFLTEVEVIEVIPCTLIGGSRKSTNLYRTRFTETYIIKVGDEIKEVELDKLVQPPVS